MENNNIVIPPTPLAQRSLLEREIGVMWDRIRVLGEFEKKHHEFLVAMEGGYYVTLNGSLVFYSDQRAEVRAHFGPEHWLLVGNIVEKVCDGVTIRWIGPVRDEGEEVEI